MRFANLAVGIAGLLILLDAPAMSPVPGASQSPTKQTELIGSFLSTQNRSECVGRGENCAGRTCCDGRYCKENGGGESLCR
ncbi:hypothetical protein CLV78_11927 [Aliiruegeria haliotis]|uniref:Uncharacterized protein n=1 Tax=Aliiruegeria haliotis TaxID=1280846 RepID=A0A2T0REV7_9RHOB|nr:hypothetical protein CLV78_11927 [Aliiruegeria haliotis]